jgi:uncharacterized surface protein with fasciclin (FAS1) repeats
MKIQHRGNLIKKLVGLIGVTGVSVVIAFPVGAQNPGGAVNPHPSIFNEPPYNRSGSTQSTPGITPSTPSDNRSMTGTVSGNVVAVAASNGSFKTLTAALKAAGLDKTLAGAGPFTVFAPTDQAFAALPPDALQKLLQPQNKDLLVKILTYHVVQGKVQSSTLKSGDIETVEGSPVTINVGNTGVMVNKAKVVQAGIRASNGVIYVIDRVMLPRDLLS